MNAEQRTFLDRVLERLEREDKKYAVDNEPFKIVQSVVNVLLHAMARYYPPFAFKTIDDNSFFVAKSSTKFEIVVCLKRLKSAHLCVEESSLPLGLALVRIPDTTTAEQSWKSLCVRSRFGKEYLSPNFLRSSISKLLTRLVQDIESVREEFHIIDGIQIANTSTVDNLSLNIYIGEVLYSVDLLPAIRCYGVWPACAHNWRAVKSTVHQDRRRHILHSGVHLVAKTARVGFHWRIWFIEPERLVMQFDEFPCKRKCFRLFKKLVFGFLECLFLSSYHLYTILLHESARFPEQEHWHHSQLNTRVRGLLLRLYQCVTTSYCQHFFITSLNLFRGISTGALEDFSRKLERVLCINDNLSPGEDGHGSTLCVYQNSLLPTEITVHTTWL